MKILIATQCFPPNIGGIEHVMGNIAIQASKLNHTVYVVSDKSKEASDKFDEKHKYIIFRFGQIKYFRKLKKANYINHLLATENFDQIYFDSWKSLEYVNNKYQSEKFICLVHGNEILKDKNRNRIVKNISKANTVIFNSLSTQLIYKNKFVTSKIKKSNIIYPAFIDENKKPDISKKKYDFCTIARLEKRKGHELILQALEKLKNIDNLICSYAILGRGEELNYLKSLVMKYSLQNQVFFLDGLDRNQVLIDSRIHVMPTFLEGNSIEGFGISNVEAAAYGLPCIVSNSGGTPESIIQNQTGLIVKEKNIDNLRHSMKELITNKSQYEKFSSKSLTFAQGFLKEKKIIEYLNSL